MTTRSRHPQPRFEEVYPKAPFAELIRLTLSLAGKVARRRSSKGRNPDIRRLGYRQPTA